MARAEAARIKELVKFAPIKIFQDTVRPKVEIDFREITLDDKIIFNLN